MMSLNHYDQRDFPFPLDDN